jgi:FHS family Na+ dependent glucose MFS transporter 1
VGRLLSIPIAARLRPRWILTGDLAGCFIGLGLILLFPESAAMLWAGAVVVGLSMASIFPTMISLAERRMTLTGATTSLFFVGASFGGMFLPWLVGQLFEPVGPQVTMIIIVIDLLVAVVAFLAVMGVSRSLQQTHS